MRPLEVVVPSQQEGRSVESVLRSCLHLSGRQIIQCKYHGQITVDGAPCHTNRTVHAGERLCVLFPQDRPVWQGTHESALPLCLVYEDEDLLVIDKQAPLPTMSSGRFHDDTLEDMVYTHLGCPERYVYRPVNRLDKGTSGLMVVALNAFSQEKLQRQLHTEAFVRTYVALLEGLLPSPEGVLDWPLKKESAQSVRRVKAGPDGDGKKALTHYRVLETCGKRTLAGLRLETGRTHQIRAHMSIAGCAVVGDYLYGMPHPALEGRFALHAVSVRFTHPLSGKELSFETPVPALFYTLLRQQAP